MTASPLNAGRSTPDRGHLLPQLTELRLVDTAWHGLDTREELGRAAPRHARAAQRAASASSRTPRSIGPQLVHGFVPAAARPSSVERRRWNHISACVAVVHLLSEWSPRRRRPFVDHPDTFRAARQISVEQCPVQPVARDRARPTRRAFAAAQRAGPGRLLFRLAVERELVEQWWGACRARRAPVERPRVPDLVLRDQTREAETSSSEEGRRCRQLQVAPAGIQFVICNQRGAGRCGHSFITASAPCQACREHSRLVEARLDGARIAGVGGKLVRELADLVDRLAWDKPQRDPTPDGARTCSRT